ncbi:hypothetical protein CR513_12471, partial [Mucuna pruriens]
MTKYGVVGLLQRLGMTTFIHEETKLVNKTKIGMLAQLYEIFKMSEEKDNKNLGKFDPKSDNGVFIGYFETSKAYRVYNSRTLTWKKPSMSSHLRSNIGGPRPIPSRLGQATTKWPNFQQPNKERPSYVFHVSHPT